MPVQPVQPVQDVQHQSLAHEATPVEWLAFLESLEAWGVAEPAPSTPSSISIPQAQKSHSDQEGFENKLHKLLQSTESSRINEHKHIM